MDEDLVYIRGRVDEIANLVSEFKVYIKTCNEDRNLLFDHVRILKKDVTELKTQSLGKNKTVDFVIKILTLFIGAGIFISGIVFWIIRLTTD